MVILVSILLFIIFTWFLFSDTGMAIIIGFLVLVFGVFALGVFLIFIVALAHTIVN